jgi:hypothetical protein
MDTDFHGMSCQLSVFSLDMKFRDMEVSNE